MDLRPAAAALLAMLAAVAVAHGQMGPDDGLPGGGPPDGGPPDGGPPAMHHHHPTTGPAETPSPVSGTVDAYNRDPRGRINGLILHDGDHVVQLNVPPDWADALQAAAPLKDSVSATAVPELVVGDRTIERLVTLSGHGKTITVSRPGDGKAVHVDGTVAQLNYTPRGEVDGAMLDTGDFVHVGPPGAATLKLAVGQKLSVDGRAESNGNDHPAIEAETVNGTAVPRPPHPRHEGPGMGPMHRGPGEHDGGPGGRGGDHGPDHGGPGGMEGDGNPPPDGGPPSPPPSNN